jgi:hypothetical protein
MSGLYKHFDFTSSTAAEGLGLSIRNRRSPRQALNGLDTLANFPKRPDLTVLSETIPLFYIAQNNHGFWVAREASGRCGGVFLLRRSAVRFAQQKSAPAGCATMLLDDPLELDVTNEGSRIVEPLTEIIDFVRRRAPTFTAFVSMTLAKWRKFDAQILLFCSSNAKDRAAPELIRGRCTPSSKNGDDAFP